MNRGRRQSTINKPSIVESENETEEYESDEYEPPTSKKSQNLKKSTKSRKTEKKGTPEAEAKKFRMKRGEDDIFVKLCIENFDQINDMSTIRGISTSSGAKSRQKILEDKWEKITKMMNKSVNVSNFFLNIYCPFAGLLYMFAFCDELYLKSVTRSFHSNYFISLNSLLFLRFSRKLHS